jgi:hypothetical protein
MHLFSRTSISRHHRAARNVTPALDSLELRCLSSTVPKRHKQVDWRLVHTIEVSPAHLSDDPQKWPMGQIKQEINEFTKPDTKRKWPDN